MSTVVIRSFDDLSAASLACIQLKDAGVPTDRVAMQTLDDEAGPVEGNFVAGSGRSNPSDAPPRGRQIEEQLEYRDDFKHAVNRSTHVVIVHCVDEPEGARAAQVLESLGGRDPDPRP